MFNRERVSNPLYFISFYPKYWSLVLLHLVLCLLVACRVIVQHHGSQTHPSRCRRSSCGVSSLCRFEEQEKRKRKREVRFEAWQDSARNPTYREGEGKTQESPPEDETAGETRRSRGNASQGGRIHFPLFAHWRVQICECLDSGHGETISHLLPHGSDDYDLCAFHQFFGTGAKQSEFHPQCLLGGHSGLYGCLSAPGELLSLLLYSGCSGCSAWMYVQRRFGGCFSDMGDQKFSHVQQMNHQIMERCAMLKKIAIHRKTVGLVLGFPILLRKI